MIQKVALFDFDNTVKKGDSIVNFIMYDLKRYPWHILKLVKVAWYYVLYKCHYKSFIEAKSQLLYPLDYMSDKELESFYYHEIEKDYYDNVVKVMQQHKDDGYVVILCTASVEAYMRYNRLPVDVTIGTQTRRVNGHETRHIVGLNCRKENKVPRILDYLKEHDIEIDYDHSYGYSDSNDDIPMLNLVKHRKRVCLKSGKIIDFIP